MKKYVTTQDPQVHETYKSINNVVNTALICKVASSTFSLSLTTLHYSFVLTSPCLYLVTRSTIIFFYSNILCCSFIISNFIFHCPFLISSYKLTSVLQTISLSLIPVFHRYIHFYFLGTVFLFGKLSL